jgi:hypothetical protein
MGTIKLEMLLKHNLKNEEILECIVDGAVFSINFTSDNQNQLRMFFLVVLKKAMESEIEFVYRKDDSFNNVIFEEVAQEYVKGLTDEIKNIRAEIVDIASSQKESETDISKNE